MFHSLLRSKEKAAANPANLPCLWYAGLLLECCSLPAISACHVWSINFPRLSPRVFVAGSLPFVHNFRTGGSLLHCKWLVASGSRKPATDTVPVAKRLGVCTWPTLQQFSLCLHALISACTSQSYQATLHTLAQLLWLLLLPSSLCQRRSALTALPAIAPLRVFICIRRGFRSPPPVVHESL